MIRIFANALLALILVLGVFVVVNAQEAVNLPLESISYLESRFVLTTENEWIFLAKSGNNEFLFDLSDSSISLVGAAEIQEETIFWNELDGGAGFLSDDDIIVWMGDAEPRNYHKLSPLSDDSLYSVVTQDDQLFVGYDMESMTLVDGRSDDSSVHIVDATMVQSLHYQFGWRDDQQALYVTLKHLVIVYSEGTVVYLNLPEIEE